MCTTTAKINLLLLAAALLLASACGDSTNIGDEETDPEPIPPSTDIPTAANDGLEAVDLSNIEASNMVSAGTGTHSRAQEQISVDVPSGATVERVFLYWAQRGTEEVQLTDSSTVMINGSAIIGDISGGPVDSPSDIPAGVTYSADITGEGIISPGSNTFTIQDDPSAQINPLGASVLVFYAMEGEESDLFLYDGVDFAWKPSQSADSLKQEALKNSVPVTFRFDTAGVAREAELILFIGDINPDEADERPNSLRIEVGTAPTEQIGPMPNPFQGFQGRDWDNYVQTITIPNGVGKLTVFPVSGPGNRPTSLVWSLAGFSIPAAQDSTE
jgi:hypothetical protein